MLYGRPRIGPVTSPDSLGAIRGPGGHSLRYSSIGAVCEGNTDTISARQVSVGLISGWAQQFSGEEDPQEPSWWRGCLGYKGYGYNPFRIFSQRFNDLQNYEFSYRIIKNLKNSYIMYTHYRINFLIRMLRIRRNIITYIWIRINISIMSSRAVRSIRGLRQVLDLPAYRHCRTEWCMLTCSRTVHIRKANISQKHW